LEFHEPPHPLQTALEGNARDHRAREGCHFKRRKYQLPRCVSGGISGQLLHKGHSFCVQEILKESVFTSKHYGFKIRKRLLVLCTKNTPPDHCCGLPGWRMEKSGESPFLHWAPEALSHRLDSCLELPDTPV
jgi:hypothetical protein